MNKNTFLLCIALVFLLAINLNLKAQSEEKRDVKGFNQISYSLSAALEISQGDVEELVLLGEKDDLDNILTKVDNGQLKIYRQKASLKDIGDVKVRLVVKSLEELSVSGSGNVTFKTDLKVETLEIGLSGSGDINCKKLHADKLEINLAGSGTIVLGGDLKSGLEINIAGSGNVETSELMSREVEVNIAGSGDAKVWAVEELESNITGSGSVHYKGSPAVNSSVTGSGSTKQL